MKMKKLIVIALMSIICTAASAQSWSLGTNAADYVNLGTLNIEGSAAVGRHVTLNVATRYNPWAFRYGREDQFQNRRQNYSAGIRWWPWHVYSGWWGSARVQYEQYNRGGIFSKDTSEGDAWGAAIAAGYTLMLSDHFNLEFGAGLWGGMDWYMTYSCPRCGRITDSGQKIFCDMDNVFINLVYIF